MSTGHVVMIVAGLLATVLTYAVLRQAAGVGTEESVAAGDIHAGQVVTPLLFATTDVKAPSSALSGILTPKEVDGMSGEIALVDIKKGQLVIRQQFRPAMPPPPSMAITVDTEPRRVDVNLNALQRMRVVERARSGGRRGTSGRAASLRARLLELHLSGEAIEAGIAGSDEPIFGPVALVGSDHIAVGEEAAPEWFVPLASLAYVAFVRTTDPSPDLGA